ncbi:MAG: 4-hydroxy-3-methylbut-2-enyl diphosphate reductase [Alphaproteobacteria bacterium]|nr:4-hydroxy-3-methylbut-2-enyl diphosphate reductase [Alphaproteobacteria bacterium]
MSTAPLTVYLAAPRGFCAGVDRAIEIVEQALALYGAPIYVRHEIVHNRWVVEDLRAKGVVFVEEVDEIPAGGITVFSAHGISEKVENEAKLRALPIIDATCPLVTKVHNQARRYEREGFEIVLIGHAGHPEVEGTSGRVKKVYLVENLADVAALTVATPDKLAYVTQTTLSVDDTKSIIAALKQRFPAIHGPDTRDICYATQNRQQAVRDLAKQVQLLLVVGSKNSSNSNRLRDLGAECGIPAYLIDDAADIDPAWLNGIDKIGLTAGASAPELLVDRVVKFLETLRVVTVEPFMVVEEHVAFNLPPEVRAKPFKDRLRSHPA